MIEVQHLRRVKADYRALSLPRRARETSQGLAVSAADGRTVGALAISAAAPHECRSGIGMHGAAPLFTFCTTLARPDGCRRSKTGVQRNCSLNSDSRAQASHLSA